MNRADTPWLPGLAEVRDHIDGAEGVALQADGSIGVGGFARNAGTTVFAMARLMP